MSTVIQLQNFQDNSIAIKINGGNFYDILEIIKNLPVRNYIRQERIWTIPFGDLALFVTKIKKYDKNITIKIEKNIKEKYFQFKEWKENQLLIKNDNNYELINQIKNELIFNKKMYPFQLIGAYFLYEAGDALLCDMVGLGKTVQSLCVNETHFHDKTINFTIIICPSTLKKNWENEINLWTNDKTSIIIGGTKSQRKKQYKSAYKYDYMIMNYDLLNSDINLINEFIIQSDFTYSVIIDEIQYIKNYKTKRSKHTKNISASAKFSIGLSATAIENSLLDLWSIFQGINESVFGGTGLYWHFKDKYLVMDFFGSAIDYKNEAIVKNRMSPYLIRRMKDEVLNELPDRIENNYWVELSPEQRKFYDDVSNKVVTEIENQEKANKIQMADIMPMMVYLRQCVLSAKLVGHKDNISTKTIQLMKFIESLDEDSKIVVFVHFIGMVEILKKELDEKNIKNICIHGNMKSPLGCAINDRVEVIKKFNTDKTIKILVTSDILTEGVNITSANYVVNLDMLFNPAKMEQRIGRIDRIGNKHKVINIVNIIASDTIEQHIYEKIWKKRNMSTDIMDNNKIENRLTIKNIKSWLEVKSKKLK